MEPRKKTDDLAIRYGMLPEVIKASITEEEYRWLSDEQREDLFAELTSPPPEPEY